MLGTIQIETDNIFQFLREPGTVADLETKNGDEKKAPEAAVACGRSCMG